MSCRKVTHRREGSLFWRAAVVRRASCGLKELAGVHVACASAPLRSFYLGRRRSARACCVRAPCRSGCGRSVPCERPLHRREATLLRRAAVIRRASCGFKELAGVHVACASAPLRSLYLGRRRSARACCERAPCRAGCGRPMPYKRPLNRREATLFGARPWCDVPDAAFQNEPDFA